MKFRKKPRLTPSEIRILSLIGFVLLILVSVLIGVNIGLSRVIAGGGEFYSAWNGARLFMFEHVNPYNLDVAIRSEQLAYGHPAASGQNPDYLTLPFFLLPIYFPFAFLSDYLSSIFPSKFVVDPVVVRGLWLILNEVFLLIISFLVLRLIEWSPHRIFLIAFLLLSIFSFYSVSALLDGTPAILLCLLYYGILSALQNQHDELAGALTAFTLFRWEVGLFFLIFVLWRVYSEKRSRVFYGLGMILAVLLIASFLLNPGWVIPFLQSSLTDLRSNYGFNCFAILVRFFPAFPIRFLWIVPVSLIIWVGLEWRASRERDFHHFIWTCCLTLAVTPLLGIRTEFSNLVVLFPASALIFATIVERWHYGYGLNVLVYLIVLLLPWGFFLRSVIYQSQTYQDLLSIFFPVFIIIGLYWTRWWFIRPPRTWLDYARSSRS